MLVISFSVFKFVRPNEDASNASQALAFREDVREGGMEPREDNEQEARFKVALGGVVLSSVWWIR